jgi:hypothetical protein
MIIGASGDSYVDAVARIAGAYGEEFIHLYADAKDEISAKIAGLEEFDAAKYEKVFGPTVPEFDSEPPPTMEQPSFADTPEELPRDGGSNTASTVTNNEDATADSCVICGTVVTADQAKASNMMIGEIRCRECTA